MAFFEGGKIPLIGVTPQDLVNPLTQAATSTLFQGSGKSFLGRAGQTLVTAVGQNILNVGLSKALNSNIINTSGVDLSSGQTFLASVITPSITSGVSNLMNQGISNALQSAGPFGPVLSQIATTATGGLLNSLTGALGLGGGAGAGAGAEAGSGPSRRFPGAGDEPQADYSGGGAYTLGPNGPDVVFTLQPANQGPQLFGQDELTSIPKSFTTQAWKQLSNVTNNVGAAFNTDNLGKITEIVPGAAAAIAGGKDYSSIFNPNSKVGNPQDTAAAYGDGNNPAWTFICAPENISWDLQNRTDRIDMFGTNNPPVVAGTKGMRDLTIGNALVEGFTRGVTVEGKINALEKLTEYNLNGADGFVSVPVYQFWANKKQYGGSSPEEGGYFLIKDVKVTEKMRDLQGYTTRATVDITLIQVPQYQVNSGRDQASKGTAGVASRFISQADQNNINAGRNGPAQQAQRQTQGKGSGPTVPKNAAAATGGNAQTPSVQGVDLLTPIPYQVRQ
jgi:hypothetical protein